MPDGLKIGPPPRAEAKAQRQERASSTAAEMRVVAPGIAGHADDSSPDAAKGRPGGEKDAKAVDPVNNYARPLVRSSADRWYEASRSSRLGGVAGRPPPLVV